MFAGRGVTCPSIESGPLEWVRAILAHPRREVVNDDTNSVRLVLVNIGTRC